MARQEREADAQYGATPDDLPLALDSAVEHVRHEQRSTGASRHRSRVPRPVDAVTVDGLPNAAPAVEHDHAAGLGRGGLPVGRWRAADEDPVSDDRQGGREPDPAGTGARQSALGDVSEQGSVAAGADLDDRRPGALQVL